MSNEVQASTKDLTVLQLKAITFLVAKDVYRLTDAQIAEQIGISTVTLYNWKRLPEFNEELQKQAKELNKATLADVYSYIRKTLNNPKATDTTKVKLAELVMKSQGEFKNQQIDHSVSVNSEKSLDELFKELGV